MNLLPIGTDDILSQSGATVVAATSAAVNSAVLVNQSATYVVNSITTLDVYYQIATQSYTFNETNSISFTPDLSCSFSGSTSISFSISKYGSSVVPSYISINSSSGKLTISEPSVDADTEIDFYVNSINTGLSSQAQKLIKLKIISWKVDNWRFCSSSDISIWIVCESGYDIYYNEWSSHITQTIIPIEIAIVWATILIIVVMNLINSSSIEIIWSIINQMQLRFLILLTGAFIPLDIKRIIQGFAFAINIYSNIPLSKAKFGSSIFSKYNFASSNLALQDVGVDSDGSIYNIHVMLVVILIIIPLHICLYFALNKISRMPEQRRCKSFWKVLKWGITNLYKILTFGFYIRNLLQMELFIMLYTIYEISILNTEDANHITSLIFAILMVLFYIVFIIFTLWIVFSSYKIDENNHNKLGEFLVGLKPYKKTRFHIGVVLIRRVIYATLFICLVSPVTNSIIYIFVPLQFCFILYIAVLRPYNKTKANIIEILNEIYMFAFLLWLAIFSKKEDWGSISISWYAWILISNSMMNFLIILSKLF